MNKPWDTFPDLQNPLAPVPVPAKVPTTAPARPPLFGLSPVDPQTHRIAIIGAGLAGCWLARILAEQGIAVTLYEKQTSVASAASGNPAGIAKPFVTRNKSLAMSFHCIAHQFLLNRLRLFNLEAAAEFNLCGVLQLVEKPYPPSDSYENLSELEATAFAGVPLNSHALKFTDAGWLNPHQLCCHLVEHSLISLVLGKQITGIRNSGTPFQVGTATRTATTTSESCAETGIEATNESDPEFTHRLEFHEGDPAFATHVVLTTGSATNLIPDTHHLPITIARGQLSRFSLSEDTVAPKCVVNGKHYVIPDERCHSGSAAGSLLAGASFHRDNSDSTVSEIDHKANLYGLRQLLPSLKVDPQAIAGYAGVRATTPDRLPIVGPLPDFAAATEIYNDIRHGRSLADYPPLPCRRGIYMIGGLGSRGIVTAPLCAQLLADHLTQATVKHKPQDASKTTTDELFSRLNYETLEYWARLINPARFLIRNLKRNA